MAKKMNFSLKRPIEYLDCDEDDDIGFTENAVDNPNAIVTFSFINGSSSVPTSSLPLDSSRSQNSGTSTGSSLQINSNGSHNNSESLNSSITKVPEAEAKPPAIAITKIPVENKKTSPHELVDNRTLQLRANGITPPIDGENFEIKRTFLFRRSTVKMLNKLKAEHPDENVYLSTIVDEALRNYYDIVFNKVGKDKKIL